MNKYRYLFPEDNSIEQSGGLSVSYWGANSLVVSSGESSLLIDPHFTRPERAALFSLQRPDEKKIKEGLHEAGVGRADLVLLTHTHYDHALDAAVAASYTGARLAGSQSAVMIGRGGELPEDRLVEIMPGQELQAGDFTITFIRSNHVPLPFPISLRDGIGETIETPVLPPVKLWEYKEGGTYHLFISHQLGRILVSGSAGWITGGLNGFNADVVILAAGGLAFRGKQYMKTYYKETVRAVQAKQVYVTHWDDFTRSVDVPLRLGGLSGWNLDHLVEISLECGDCELYLMPFGRRIRLFREKGENR